MNTLSPYTQQIISTNKQKIVLNFSKKNLIIMNTKKILMIIIIIINNDDILKKNFLFTFVNFFI